MKRSDVASSSSSSSSRQLSTSYIQGVLEQLECSNARETTKTSYLKVWRAFNKFLINLDKQLDGKSLWEERTALFVAYLVDRRAQSSTIKSYVSAIKFMLKSVNYDWDDNAILLTAITHSCRIQNDILKVRMPIGYKLFEDLLFELENMFKTQPYLEVLYKAIFSLAFYGLMRVGELTLTDAPHTLKATNVHIGVNKKKFLIVLYSSKTHDQANKLQYIKVKEASNRSGQKKSSFCPFEILQSYENICGGIDDPLNENFFVFSDKSPVKAVHFRSTLKTALEGANMDPAAFNTHSFRIGMTTELFKAGYRGGAGTARLANQARHDLFFSSTLFHK